MPNTLSPASSSRSKCRGCGRSILKGELRFGEMLPNPYREGEAVYWFHPVCAACMRPEAFLSALDAGDAPIEERVWLRRCAEQGAAHRRLPRLARAERAKSGRALCRLCREPMAKDKFRLTLQMFEEGRMQAIGSIHPECAEAYFGTAGVLDRIARLTPAIEPDELSEIEAALAEQRPATPEALGPTLKKTFPPIEQPVAAKPRRG